MEFSITTVTPPEGLPISLDEARAHSALCNSCDDVKLAAMIAQAVDYFENATHRRLLNQTVRIAFDRCPGGVLDLPIGPVAAVVSAEVRTETNVETGVQTFAAIATPGLVGARVQRAYWPSNVAAWPSIDPGPESLRLTLTVGYGAVGASVPPSIIGALKLLTGHFYENREASIVGTTASPLPYGVDAVIDQYRIPMYG